MEGLDYSLHELAMSRVKTLRFEDISDLLDLFNEKRKIHTFECRSILQTIGRNLFTAGKEGLEAIYLPEGKYDSGLARKRLQLVRDIVNREEYTLSPSERAPITKRNLG